MSRANEISRAIARMDRNCTPGKTVPCGKACRQPQNCKQKSGNKTPAPQAAKPQEISSALVFKGGSITPFGDRAQSKEEPKSSKSKAKSKSSSKAPPDPTKPKPPKRVSHPDETKLRGKKGTPEYEAARKKYNDYQNAADQYAKDYQKWRQKQKKQQSGGLIDKPKGYTKAAHQILGVPKNATFEQVKAAYRKRSLEYHPDRNSGKSMTEKQQELNAAYELYLKTTGRKDSLLDRIDSLLEALYV